MSLNVSGQKCAVCNAYLFPEDDIVYCPECGAPHHRECYNSLGHCGLQEFHGTENEYDRNKAQNEPPKTENNAEASYTNHTYGANNASDTYNYNNQSNQTNTSQQNAYQNYFVVCGVCGTKYNPEDASCPNCNAPNIAKAGPKFEGFDFSGGVPDDTDLGNGVTTQEAKMYVRVNTQRYMPKFLKFKNGGKASWNLFAFLTPSAWLMSRKMYVLGSIVATLEVAFYMFMFPFIKALNSYDMSEFTSQEMVDFIMENMSSIGEITVLTAVIAAYALIGIRVIFGVFGDLFYSKKAISKITEIKQADTDVNETLQKSGGVNLILAIVTCLVVFRLPQIIAILLGIL